MAYFYWHAFNLRPSRRSFKQVYASHKHKNVLSQSFTKNQEGNTTPISFKYTVYYIIATEVFRR